MHSVLNCDRQAVKAQREEIKNYVNSCTSKIICIKSKEKRTGGRREEVGKETVKNRKKKLLVFAQFTQRLTVNRGGGGAEEVATGAPTTAEEAGLQIFAWRATEQAHGR